MNSSFESLIEQYPLPIAEQLRHWTARYASRIAVVDAKGSLTYSALDAQVDELAAGLSSLGLRSGEHVIVQLPNDNAFVTLLFALLRLGVIPVLAMPSQRALDIDALIELAQPVAYVIHGENHAELARQMAHKHACLRHVLVAGETVSDDLRRSSPFTVSDRHGRSLMFPPPRCCCSQAAQPARPNSSRADMPTIAITSALLLNCAASANRACISPSSRWRITFRWPAPVFWERLPAAEKWC